MPRVLIVDDNRSLLTIFAIAVRRGGYEVEVAHDAESGLECLTRSEFDLVLTDLKLPGMTGIDFIHEAVRRRNKSAVALMTGTPNPDVLGSGYPCLLKPFNATELLRFVDSLVQIPA